MNRLNPDKQKQVIAALVEGNSIRATCRMTGVAKGTVLKLLADIGTVCAEYQHEHRRDLTCKKILCDEIWSFCYSKDKNVPEDKKGKFGYGDVWTWTAICADSKLVPAFFIGSRDLVSAKVFMNDLASRMEHRIQITTDGHKAYIEAVEDAFDSDVDYSQLVKLYGVERIEAEARYSPAKCIGAKKQRVTQMMMLFLQAM